MEKWITFFFKCAYIITIAISLIVLVYKTRKKTLPINLKFLYLYPLGSLIVFGIFLLGNFGVIEITTYIKINSLSLLYHLGFLGAFIIYEIKNIRLKKMSKILFGIFNFFLFLGIYFRSSLWHLDVLAANMGLFVLSTLYFIDIFVTVPEVKLSRIPAFWIVIGVFVNMVISIPPLTLVTYINLYFPENFVFLVVITLGSSIFMFLSFIKGALCIKSHQKL